MLQASSCSASFSYVSRSSHPEDVLANTSQAVWMFYYGSNQQAPHRVTIDSFALNKDQRQSMNSRHMSHSNALTPNMNRPPPQTAAQHLYTSNQLTGFETSSPTVTSYPAGTMNMSRGMSPGPQGPRSPPVGGQFGAPQQPQQQFQPQEPAGGAFGAAPMEGGGQTEYPYRAKAIYSYDANPQDPNEISFSKHEILEVSDVSGRWWQAKKENGETGIAPSNYLILL